METRPLRNTASTRNITARLPLSQPLTPPFPRLYTVITAISYAIGENRLQSYLRSGAISGVSICQAMARTLGRATASPHSMKQIVANVRREKRARSRGSWTAMKTSMRLARESVTDMLVVVEAQAGLRNTSLCSFDNQLFTFAAYASQPSLTPPQSWSFSSPPTLQLIVRDNLRPASPQHRIPFYLLLTKPISQCHGISPSGPGSSTPSTLP